MRLSRSGSSASLGRLGLKSGSDTQAMTSPVLMLSTTPAPALAEKCSTALAISDLSANCTEVSSDSGTGSAAWWAGSASEAV